MQRNVSIDGQFIDLTPFSEFGNKTACDMILNGKIDDVISALAADYEGHS